MVTSAAEHEKHPEGDAAYIQLQHRTLEPPPHTRPIGTLRVF